VIERQCDAYIVGSGDEILECFSGSQPIISANGECPELGETALHDQIIGGACQRQVISACLEHEILPGLAQDLGGRGRDKLLNWCDNQHTALYFHHGGRIHRAAQLCLSGGTECAGFSRM